MKKMFALLKASFSEGMSFFIIRGKNRSKFMRVYVPIIIGIMFMLAMGSYGEMMMEPLAGTGLEYVVLTLFVVFSAVFTLVEGVYKAGGLLFNCRDDDIVLALPIKKSTVLLIRIFKFYVFEVMVNALFLAPVMLVYALKIGASLSFYITSIVGLFVLPIFPVVLSCLIGGLIAYSSSKFRLKNIVQIILTTLVMLIVLYISYNLNDILSSFAQNAGSINEIILRLYYPALQYINLVIDFNILNFVLFIIINVGILLLTVLILGKVYYKINSQVKVVKGNNRKHDYKTVSNRPIIALIKKELNKFVSSPVFVINAGFGLVLFIVACVLLVMNGEGLLSQFMETEDGLVLVERILSFIPAVLFGLIFVTSMMTSITSSMISLEGKAFNILKSLPVSAMTIIMAKVLAAIVVMVPIVLAGDLIMFVKYDFNVWQILMIIVTSIIMPMAAELIGIIINLKYPKMNAKDDVEVVKQSLSSLIAVFVGMGASVLILAIIGFAFFGGVSATETIGAGLLLSAGMMALALFYLKAKGVEDFNAIGV